MLGSLVLSIISIFAVFGLFCLILFACGKTLYNTPVVMCTYNNEETIENDIKEVINKYGDTEIIIVDFGSSDETEKIVKILQSEYKCIKFVERRTINEKQIDKN